MFTEESKNILKQALKKAAIDRIMKELVLSSSFFAYPGINRLTLMAVEWIVNYILEKTELGLYFMYTNYTVETQVKELQAALKKQRENPNEENEKELISKFDDLIRIRPK